MPKTQSPVYLINMTEDEWKAANYAAKFFIDQGKKPPFFITKNELRLNKNKKLLSVPLINFNHDITVIPDEDSYKVGVTARAEAYFNPESTNKIIRNAKARKVDIDAEIEKIPKTEEEGKLGAGGFGCVEVVQYEDGSIDAVKIENAELANTNEIAILKELGNFRASFIKKNENRYLDNKGVIVNVLHTIQKIYPGISLSSYFRSIDMKNAITPEQKYMIAMQAALSIKQLHDKNILHRDIKPDNFIINCDGATATVTAIDFGLSDRLDLEYDHKMGRRNIGTFLYMAPEVRKEGRYSKQADIYALGCLFEQLFENNFTDDARIKNLVDWMRQPIVSNRASIEDVIESLKLQYNEQDFVRSIEPGKMTTAENKKSQKINKRLLEFINKDTDRKCCSAVPGLIFKQDTACEHGLEDLPESEIAGRCLDIKANFVSDHSV